MSALYRTPPGASRATTDGGDRDETPYAASAATPESGAPRPTGRRRLLVWGSITLLVVLVALLMTSRSDPASNAVPLDPRNPTVNGAQALDRVLVGHGVSVDIARGQEELLSAGIDADTTVLLTRTDDLARATVETLAGASIDAERLVLVTPQDFALRYLDPDVDSVAGLHQGGDLQTGCDGGDVRPGEQLSHSQAGYRYQPPTGDGVSGGQTTACWRDAEGYATYLAMPATADHAPLVLLGSSAAVRNDEIAQADNAAVVLRTLGHSARVVWYIPSTADIPTTDRSRTGQLLPPWLGPALVLVAMSVLGLMLWRGRRLGRLVREPLPVVVRAIETTQSRGRLYRKARDSTRAGLVLQEATRRRLAGFLGLPPGGRVDVLVRATAAATGRPEPEVGYLLAGPPPATDDDLLGLAGRLATLEKEVRRT